MERDEPLFSIDDEVAAQVADVLKNERPQEVDFMELVREGRTAAEIAERAGEVQDELHQMIDDLREEMANVMATVAQIAREQDAHDAAKLVPWSPPQPSLALPAPAAKPRRSRRA